MRIEGCTCGNGNIISTQMNRGGIEDVTKLLETHENSNQTFPGENQLLQAMEKSEFEFQVSNTSLKFSIHEKTNQIMVKLIDNTTQEVIREIPPEKIVDLVAAMIERTGIFVDKKA